MEKGIRLSHSSVDKYNTCSMMWKLHYLDKLRPKTKSSAFIFGSAIDDAVGIILLKKKTNLTEKEKLLVNVCPYDYFIAKMEYGEINKTPVYYPLETRMDYFKSDCDITVLTKSCLKEIKHVADCHGLEINVLKDYIAYCQKNINSLDEDEKKIYNFICWKCLEQKGLLLIEAFVEQVLPKIDEVYEIQKKIELHDQHDLLVGYIDFIASFVDCPGVKYVCDLKTSSRAYLEDSVANSQQLAIYCEHEEIYKAAYIVLEKKIRKKEPRVRVQIIKDEVSEELFEQTFERIGDTLQNIKEEKFEKNWDSCFQYGRMCPYHQLCKYGNKTDLEDLKNA